jgi:hypothetical protein
MPDAVGRLSYFLLHPSEYLGLWTLDLAVASALLAIATFWIVLRQLRIMRTQTTLMQQQTTIMTAQDELNRVLLARRIKLHVYAVEEPAKVIFYCANDGGRMTQSFYCHLYIPAEIIKNGVWYGSGGAHVELTDSLQMEGVLCNHYRIMSDHSLFPTREVKVANFTKSGLLLPMWWKTVSEDGVAPAEGLNPVELRAAATPGATDAAF